MKNFALIDSHSLEDYQKTHTDNGDMFTGKTRQQVLSSVNFYVRIFRCTYTKRRRILPLTVEQLTYAEQSKRNKALWRKVSRMQKVTTRAMELIHCGLDPSRITQQRSQSSGITVLRYVLDMQTLTIIWKVDDPQKICDVAKHHHDYNSFTALTRDTFYTRASFHMDKVYNRKSLHITPALSKSLSRQYSNSPK